MFENSEKVLYFCGQSSHKCKMSKLKILYVASEISPFLKKTDVADYIRPLPEKMQQRGYEVRILVPRFGLINERKNRLHEVVRLSGINIPIADDEKPLVIKVASIPSAKLQVYFIDNEDFFHRKRVYTDKQGNYFEDNDERAIFFCKGVIETVKKLGWAPDIIHCSDWITGLLPAYLKVTYKNDPLFKDAKILYTIFNNALPQKFSQDLVRKALIQDVTEETLAGLESLDYEGFLKVGVRHADRVTLFNEEVKQNLNGTLEGITPDIIPPRPKEERNDFIDQYEAIYKELAGVEE